jgi:hypothetical protein
MTEENSSQEHTAAKGHIKDMGFLDLRYAKTAEDLAGIISISDVGMVLIPEHLAGVLANISVHDVGGIVNVPQDSKVNSLTGQVRISGETLAAGDPETILLVAGQLFITGEVTTVGFKEVRIFGQMFAPKSGRAAISAKLTQFTGQNFFTEAEARIIMGKESIGPEFLELLPAPATLVVLGELTFEPGTPRELVQSKLPEIVLMGKIVAPKELVPLLQVITKEKMGEIVEAE